MLKILKKSYYAFFILSAALQAETSKQPTDLLQEIVVISSPTEDAAGVRKVQTLISDHFKSLGFNVKRQKAVIRTLQGLCRHQLPRHT